MSKLVAFSMLPVERILIFRRTLCVRIFLDKSQFYEGSKLHNLVQVAHKLGITEIKTADEHLLISA